MKNSSTPSLDRAMPSEDDIRNYAFYLYQQNNSEDGHDSEHWREAVACLAANIPPDQSRTRLHQQLHGSGGGEMSLLSIEAKILAS